MKKEDEIIAAFDGYEYYGWNHPQHRCSDYKKGYWGLRDAKAHHTKVPHSVLFHLDYSSNWNSLMKVYKKILNIREWSDKRDNVIDSLQYGELDGTHERIVEFIKWWNKENNK